MPQLIRVEPVALMPTQAGCAVFLGNGEKVMVFYIDPAIGMSINSVLTGDVPERPLTHDLFMMFFDCFGAKVQRCVIVRHEEDVFYARLIVEAKNELMQRKIVELDARPSDCIALCVRAKCPMYVTQELWEQMPDVSDMLDDMRQQENQDLE